MSALLLGLTPIAAGASVPAASADWIEATLGFEKPAEAAALVSASGPWSAAWKGANAGVGSAAAFSAYGARIVGKYVEELVLNRSSGQSTYVIREEVFDLVDFRIALRQAPSIEDALVRLSGADHRSTPLSATAQWSLTTISHPIATGATPDEKGEPVRQLLLTGQRTDVTITGDPGGLIFGYDVYIDHRGGQAWMQTGSGPARLDPMLPSQYGAYQRSYFAFSAFDVDIHIVANAVPVRIVTPAVAIDGNVEFYDPTGMVTRGSGFPVEVGGEQLTLVGVLQANAAETGPNNAATRTHHIDVRGVSTGEGAIVAGAGSGGLAGSHVAWATAALGTLAGWPLARRLFLRCWKVAVALFTRFTREKVLENASRQLVLQCVEHNPGITRQEIHQLLDLSPNAVGHHLRHLIRHGLVCRFRVLKRICFAMPSVGVRLFRVRALLEQPTLRLVHDSVMNGQPAKAPEVVGRLRATFGLSRASAYNVVRRAIEEQLVGCEKQGRLHVLVPAQG